jgi:DNA-binding transcriptional MocR family regulator
MLAAIGRHLPNNVTFDIPKGGLFLWLRLPNNISADELLPVVCEEGVAFAPGSIFFTDDGNGKEWIRLNFSAQPVEDIEEGIKRLGSAIRRMAFKK